MMRIKVTKWCSRNDARACLELVLSDATEITNALVEADAGRTWVTPDSFIEAVARRFRDRIVECRGEAELVD